MQEPDAVDIAGQRAQGAGQAMLRRESSIALNHHAAGAPRRIGRRNNGTVQALHS